MKKWWWCKQVFSLLYNHPATKYFVSPTEADTSDGIRRLFWFGGQRSYDINERSKNSAVDITIKTSRNAFTARSHVLSRPISDQKPQKAHVSSTKHEILTGNLGNKKIFKSRTAAWYRFFTL